MCYPSPPFPPSSIVRERLFVLTPSGAGSVSTHLAQRNIDLMAVVGEPKEFSSKKKRMSKRGVLFVPLLSLAFPRRSNLLQSGFSLHLITWSLTPVSYNHQVPFSVTASHFPASSNCDASLHVSRFLLCCVSSHSVKGSLKIHAEGCQQS